MPRKPSQQARLALKCNPGEGTQANKAAISPQGSSNERSTPQAHRASSYATRAETKCRMSLSDRCRYPAGWHTLRGHRGISPAAKGVARVVERTAGSVQRSAMERNRACGSRNVHGIPLEERQQGRSKKGQTPLDHINPRSAKYGEHNILSQICGAKWPWQRRFSWEEGGAPPTYQSRPHSAMDSTSDPATIT